LTQEATAAPTKKPLLPFIKVTDKFPEEEAYLWGSKCSSCGTQFLGERTACGNCGSTGSFEEVRFSDEGEIYVFSVVHQSAPGIETPYVGAIIDLKDGPSVRANVIGLDPEKPSPDWFGKKVKMVAEKVATDRDGNEVIAAKFKVV
jgi:uncharacterized OB-fold protein